MAQSCKVGRDYTLSVAVENYEVVPGGSRSGLKSRLSVPSSRQHVRYRLLVLCGSSSWFLSKRFSEFVALQEALKKHHPYVPELPAKTVGRNFARECLEQRRQLLNQYLSKLCKQRDLLNNAEVQQFFGLPENLVAFEQLGSQGPIQIAELREPCYSIKALAYDPQRGVLLLGSSESSWASTMDTKITNIKLPWETESPGIPLSQMTLWSHPSKSLHFEMQFCCKYQCKIACVALADKFCLCGLGDGSVGFHTVEGDNLLNGHRLPLLRHAAKVVALAVDEERQFIISVGKDSDIFVYDLNLQMVQCQVHAPSPPTAVHYCPISKRLFTGMVNGCFSVWDTSVTPIQNLSSIPDSAESALLDICAIDYHPSTSTAFVGSKDSLTLWSVKYSTGKCWGRVVGKIRGIANPPSALVWANSSREVFAGFSSGVVCVFDVDRGEASFILPAHRDRITAMVWLDSPRRLLTASNDKTMKIWEFPSMQCISTEELGFGTVSESIKVPTEQPPSSSSGSTKDNLFGEGPLTSNFGAMKPTALTSSVGHKPSGPSGQAQIWPYKPSSAVSDNSDDDLVGWDR